MLNRTFASLALCAGILSLQVGPAAYARVISSSGKDFVVDTPKDLLTHCDTPDGLPEDASQPSLSWTGPAIRCTVVVVTKEELKSLGLFPTLSKETIALGSEEKTYTSFMGYENGKPWAADAKVGDYIIRTETVVPVGGFGGPVGEHITGYAILGSIECRPRGRAFARRFTTCKQEKMEQILSKFFKTSGTLHLTSTVGNIVSPVVVDPTLRSVDITSQQIIENGLGGYGDKQQVQIPATPQIACVFDKLTKYVTQLSGLDGVIAAKCRFTNLNYGSFGVATFDVNSCLPAIPVNVDECLN
jgi:hypothetical protein